MLLKQSKWRFRPIAIQAGHKWEDTFNYNTQIVRVFETKLTITGSYWALSEIDGFSKI